VLNVACVLRSGGEYRPEHVLALAAGVHRHLSLPHRLVCLTDLVRDVGALRGVQAVPLLRDWKGWWSKIELFRPGLFGGPVFYADLDTIVVGPLDDLVLGHRLTVLRNFWSDDRIGSGLMAWDAGVVDVERIHARFCQAPDAIMRQYVTTERWGDQAFIKRYAPEPPALWQVKHPGRVFSYKKHVLPGGGVPAGASVICYHGKPRPWQTPLWQEAA
jgi:hypothetical protein